jgi:hypothetical protein
VVELATQVHSLGVLFWRPGLFIQELASLVNGDGAGGGTDTESIKATIQHLVEVMARDHRLEEEQHQILRLYVHRAVFPLIATACFHLASEDEDTDEEYVQYRDTVFRKQCRKMMRYSLERVGVAKNFVCPVSTGDSLFDDDEDQPYAEVCAILRELSYIVVPCDMLFCLWRTGRAIYEVRVGPSTHSADQAFCGLNTFSGIDCLDDRWRSDTPRSTRRRWEAKRKTRRGSARTILCLSSCM